MANRRNKPKLVWVPNQEKNLATYAFSIHVARNSIYVTGERAGGQRTFREYESFSALCDDLHACELANLVGPHEC
jgi:hypothetical protein